MNEIWICVYRDTIEEHDEVNNLSYVLVTKDFAKQYFNERQKEFYDSMEDFLNEYTADETQDFYKYALEYDAVIAIENE